MKNELPRRRLRRGLIGLPLLGLACMAAGAAAQALPAPLDETTGALPAAAPTPLAVAPLSAPPPWQQLDPAARDEVRARYEAWRALAPAERERVRQAQARVAALPVDQQRALLTRFDAMDRLHRDGWRLGPQLGRHYAALQPLFGYVPPAQREPVLALLHALDDAQLAQLAVISQRSPPQERTALRNELLALAPAARAGWLRAHVGR